MPRLIADHMVSHIHNVCNILRILRGIFGNGTRNTLKFFRQLHAQFPVNCWNWNAKFSEIFRQLHAQFAEICRNWKAKFSEIFRQLHVQFPENCWNWNAEFSDNLQKIL